MKRRGNLFWPLLLVAIGTVMLLHAAGLLPAYLWDLLARLWPLLLIIFGLAALIQERTAATNALILIGLFALVVVVFAAGYTRQALQLAVENQQDVELELQDLVVSDTDITDVTLRVAVSLTELTLDAQDEATGTLVGEFIGSTENQLALDYEPVRGAQGTLVLTETNVNPIPILEAFGSNRLVLHLSPGVTWNLEIVGNVGSIHMDLSELDVARVDVQTSLGDVSVTLPADSKLTADIATRQGDVTLRYPEDLPIRFTKVHEVGLIGSSDRIPSGLEQLGDGSWRPKIYTEADVRAFADLRTTFGDIIVEHVE